MSDTTKELALVVFGLLTFLVVVFGGLTYRDHLNNECVMRCVEKSGADLLCKEICK